MKLTDKQKRFVDEYLIDLNATAAAIRAGYSRKTANRIGQQNLSKLDIRSAIDSRMVRSGIAIKKDIYKLLEQSGLCQGVVY